MTSLPAIDPGFQCLDVLSRNARREHDSRQSHHYQCLEHHLSLGESSELQFSTLKTSVSSGESPFRHP